MLHKSKYARAHGPGEPGDNITDFAAISFRADQAMAKRGARFHSGEAS